MKYSCNLHIEIINLKFEFYLQQIQNNMASRLNKKELYEEFKKLQKENNKLKLFLHNSEDTKNKQKNFIECQEKQIQELQEEKEHYKQKFIKERDENRRIGLIDLKEIHYKQMEKDVQKLQVKNESWEIENKVLTEYIDSKNDSIIKLEEEKHKLTQYSLSLQEEIKLKDEIIRLHESGEK